MRLRHGVFIAPYHPLNGNATVAFQRDIELIELADRYGYDEAWVGEHHSMGWETIASPELFLAYAGARTSRITLGTGVVSLPYHNPLMVANRIIQLDHMLRGRLKFGVGPGLLVQDAKMLGAEPEQLREKMVDSLEIIMRLFKGETVTKKTDWYDLREASCQILPFQDPHPEICVASTLTPSGGRLAGKYDLGMLVFATDHSSYNALQKNWEIANEVAAEHGRKMDPKRLSLVGPVHIAETREKALADCREGLLKHYEYAKRVHPGRFDIPAGKDPVEWYVENGVALIGTPDDAVKMLQTLREKQGEFGTFLITAVNWANWTAVKESYELYMNYVVPKIDNLNVSRQASLDNVYEHAAEFLQLRHDAAAKAIKQYEDDRAQH